MVHASSFNEITSWSCKQDFQLRKENRYFFLVQEPPQRILLNKTACWEAQKRNIIKESIKTNMGPNTPCWDKFFCC